MAEDGESRRFQEENREYYETRPSPITGVSDSQQTSVNKTTPPRAAAADGKEPLLQKEREERIRIFREQQEEERRKRLQDLEQSFMVARKYREQQEEDRRRKIEEARIKEIDRRQQVEERKRQIWEAEQERKEAILRRNLEREARIEARRNAQRNSMSFAFGSSTPRTFDLDLAALGNGRGPAQVLLTATSGRRSEEREFGPGAKRATSACSLDRKFGDDCMSRSMVSLSSVSRGRRRTDLIPTAPRERSTTPFSISRVAKDNSHSPSRPRSSMSGTSEISTTSSQTSAVSLRPRPAPRRPRPVSYAGSMSEQSATAASPVAKQLERQARPTGRIATNSVPKPPRAKSAGPEQHVAEPAKPTCARKPIPPPKTSEVLAKAKPHPPITRDNLRKVPNVPNPSPKINPSLENTVVPENSNVVPSNKDETQEVKNVSEEKLGNGFKVVKETVPPFQQEIIGDMSSNEEVTPSGKTRITSEEEAKAALAEKRRVAREQAEKEAELERQRQEEIRLQEEERKRQEELEQKRLEEEQLRLAELHRKMEEEKLKKAIEEQQQREKEERERKEEEMRLKAEKDEQEKKAREEAERQRLELEERLRKEEEERAERKRRVEQIMSRTRGKSAQPSGSSQPNSQAGSKSVSPVEDRKVLPTDDNQSAVNSVVTVVDQDLESQKQKITNNNISENKTDKIVNEEQKEILNVQFSNITPTDKFIEIPQAHPYNNKTSKSEQEYDGVMFDIHKSNTVVKNGLHEENLQQSLKTNISNEIVHGSNRTVQSEEIVFAMQTNGYSSHEETSCTTSPEDQSEKSDSSSGLVLDFGSGQQPLAGDSSEQTEFEQLIDLGAAPSANAHNENFLMNDDDVNSNIIPPGNPFIAFEDNMSKKQETSIADLLS